MADATHVVWESVGRTVKLVVDCRELGSELTVDSGRGPEGEVVIVEIFSVKIDSAIGPKDEEELLLIIKDELIKKLYLACVYIQDKPMNCGMEIDEQQTAASKGLQRWMTEQTKSATRNVVYVILTEQRASEREAIYGETVRVNKCL